MRKLLLILLTFASVVCAEVKTPFAYDLKCSVIKGKSDEVIVMFHGFGGDHTIAKKLKELGDFDETLVSFNFPDYGAKEGKLDLKKTAFGSIEEIKPALYVLKQCIVDAGIEKVTVYGFSAGGGALINTLAVLSTSRYDRELKRIGISKADKQKILRTIQKGYVILDVPLKSLEEIIAFTGTNAEIEAMAKRYRDNDMRPIDSLRYLESSPVNIIVHFQNPDNVLSNKDDQVFIERLKKYNSKGQTIAIIGEGEGHNGYHKELWTYYRNQKKASATAAKPASRVRITD